MSVKRQSTAALHNVAVPLTPFVRACVLECGPAAPLSRDDSFLIRSRLAI
jgi:hypothetical protein